jgi:hypothetical protein
MGFYLQMTNGLGRDVHETVLSFIAKTILLPQERVREFLLRVSGRRRL